MIDDKYMAAMHAQLDQAKACLRSEIEEMGRKYGPDVLAEMIQDLYAGNLPPDDAESRGAREFVAALAFVAASEMLVSLAQEKLDKGDK